MHSRALAVTAVAYAVLHHLGLLPDGLGAAPEGTRWTDWLDLAVAATAFGWVRRDELGVVLLVGFLPAVIGLSLVLVL